MADEDFAIRDATSSWAERFTINTSGDIKISESLGIGVAANGTTGRLDCSNDVVAYASSDKRLKENNDIFFKNNVITEEKVNENVFYIEGEEINVKIFGENKELIYINNKPLKIDF